MEKPEKSIELKMTWIGQMRSYIMFMEMGDDSNREFAKKELMKLAEKLDKWNEENNVPNGYLKPDGRSKNDPVTKWNEHKRREDEQTFNDCGDAFDY